MQGCAAQQLLAVSAGMAELRWRNSSRDCCTWDFTNLEKLWWLADVVCRQDKTGALRHQQIQCDLTQHHSSAEPQELTALQLESRIWKAEVLALGLRTVIFLYAGNEFAFSFCIANQRINSSVSSPRDSCRIKLGSCLPINISNKIAGPVRSLNSTAASPSALEGLPQP